MPLSEAVRELELLVRSRYGLVVLKTDDQERALTLVKLLSNRMNLPLFTWSLGVGVQLALDDTQASKLDLPQLSQMAQAIDRKLYSTEQPGPALEHARQTQQAALYFFEGLESLLQDPLLQAKLLDLARHFAKTEGALVVAEADPGLPTALRPHTTVLPIPTPSPAEYQSLLKSLYRDLSRSNPLAFELTREQTQGLLNSLQGLSLLEAEKILTKAILEDHKLSAADVERVMQSKKQIIEREGVLEYYPWEYNLQDLAGMHQLKQWLTKRKRLLSEPQQAKAFGLSFPKGLLLLGIPGSGKSLAAKAVASEWGLPLLRLDTGSLYNQYIGETERNFRRAMRLAEKVAPVVLWIDEIEKAFAYGSQDGGVSLRVLGSFLAWMQERREQVFVVATANSVDTLPPELLRKGRFDEIFFVDLPDLATRAQILEIHIRRRGHSLEGLNPLELAALAEGFSGAELEQAVVAALYTAFSQDQPLSHGLLVAEILGTKPLAVTRAEPIAQMRQWCRERAVLA